MTTPTLIEMAERLERASGPDRAIDCQIAAIVDPVRGDETIASLMADDRYMDREAGSAWTDGEWATLAVSVAAAPYTASLDAAMTLVPEGCSWQVSRGQVSRGMDEDQTSFASITDAGEDPALEPNDYHAFAATPALALTAACLRARASQGGE